MSELNWLEIIKLCLALHITPWEFMKLTPEEVKRLMKIYL